ncbi:MAG: hypothetical protein MJE68_00380, partial [Proteobacteria bacterium]|nr:hypothetical protein [Pseudomonadota bacterium]
MELVFVLSLVIIGAFLCQYYHARSMAYFLQDQAVPQASQTVNVNIPSNWKSQSLLFLIGDKIPECEQ